jgi:gamma-glutamyltranspeptidase/glutathione hydrolase
MRRFAAAPEPYSATHKPPLHGRHWMAITGKPLGAMAGARMFERGGNAIDAACAMLAVVCTMYDDVSWGGETQALIYDPRSKVGINGLGMARLEPLRILQSQRDENTLRRKARSRR